MKWKECQEKLDKALEKLVAEGQLRKREDSVKENTSEKKNTSKDKQVTIGAIFMPPRINRREKWLRDEEIKKKRQAYKNKKAEEDNNDSE